MMYVGIVSVQGGDSSLHLASDHGHARIVQALIEAHANTNQQNKVQSVL